MSALASTSSHSRGWYSTAPPCASKAAHTSLLRSCRMRRGNSVTTPCGESGTHTDALHERTNERTNERKAGRRVGSSISAVAVKGTPWGLAQLGHRWSTTQLEPCLSVRGCLSATASSSTTASAVRSAGAACGKAQPLTRQSLLRSRARRRFRPLRDATSCKARSGEVRSLWMQYCPTCLLQRRLVVCTAAGSRSGTADGRASVRVGLRRSFGLNESVTAESPQFEHRLSTRNAAIMPKKTTQRTSNTELEARPTPHVPCASAADHAMAWTPMSARAHYTAQQLPSP